MSCDRRILKAFYTQYVAVLLIILVFTIGAFQRASQDDVGAQRLTLAPREEPSIGGIEIAQYFTELGELGSNTAELEAVALVVRDHDVRASISLPMSIQRIDAPGPSVEESLARLAALEKFFEERGVTADSLELVLGGKDARGGKLVVRFEGGDHDNFPF
jgi:hypothetical protein